MGPASAETETDAGDCGTADAKKNGAEKIDKRVRVDVNITADGEAAGVLEQARGSCAIA